MKNKILTLLLSFAVALGLWLYVVTSISEEMDQTFYDIPVNFENETSLLDRDLMMIAGQNSTVSVRLHGSRSDLGKLNSGNMSATINLGNITEPGHYEQEYRLNYPGGMGSINVSKRMPASVSLDIVESATKEIPVKVVLRGKVEDGLIVDVENAVFSTETVTVLGPKSEVEQIAVAGLEIECGNLTENVTGEFSYTLMNSKYEPLDVGHVTTNTGSIHLSLPVEHIKEIPLVISMIPGGGATEKNTKSNIEPSTITISGSEEALSKIDSWNIATVDLGAVDIDKPFSQEFDIELPENLNNRSVVSSATVTVKLTGLVSKHVTVKQDQIQLLNVPEGMNAKVFTQRIDVVVRGPMAEMTQMTPTDVRAYVDLQDVEPGIITVPLIFEFEDLDDVGVFGKYSASVGISLQSDEG